jgi:hypothetical protein
MPLAGDASSVPHAVIHLVFEPTSSDHAGILDG